MQHLCEQVLLVSRRGGKLDFASVLKASHTLAREIVEEKLLPKLMAILMENAGAERAVLVLLPLLNQGRLHGLAYFENNLSRHVFTLARVAVLELLLSQAAISIENASLYQEPRCDVRKGAS